ncbi:MAG: tetratricopeptide repeat protein [Acidobacteriota bacterium]|nr:tetratricopeptide repeat protein [Acidobacteriota bacterium]
MNSEPLHTDDLLDIALGLEPKQRRNFVELVTQGDTAWGKKLSERLARYETFEEVLENTGGLLSLVNEWEFQEAETLPAKPGAQPPVKSEKPEVRTEAKTEEAPVQIDGLAIMERIAEGGQGAVYLARQEQPDRVVALKLMHKTGYLYDREFMFRFQREYDALARMNHRHIAKIYETGVTPEGYPYFTMEFVDGCPLNEYCREKKLGLVQRLELFRQICSGVAHAHLKLILHRDLKPRNILVTEEDGKPMVKLIDFGIAKSLDQSLGKNDFETRVAWMGTPQYMAPEQLAQGRLEPDIRMDIYALGVLLYELITDCKPHDPSRMLNLPQDEQLRIYREVDPPRPSVRLARAQTRPVRTIADDLDWIVMKAMALDPEERYPTVAALQSDCSDFLANRPVSAKAPHPLYVLRKFIRRNKLLVSTTTAATVFLFGALLMTTLAKRDAETSQVRFEKSFQTLESVLTAPHEMGVDTRMLDVLQLGENSWEASVHTDPVLESMIRRVWGKTYHGLNLYDKALEHFKRNQVLLRKERGPTHPETLRNDYFLARTLYRRGEYKTARLLLEETYDAQYRRLGLQPEVLETLTELAWVLRKQGLNKDAAALLAGVRERAEALPESQALAKYLVSLAIIQKPDGNQTENLLRKALAIQTRLLGPEHPNTLATTSNLANRLRILDKFADSEALYRKVIIIRTRKLGPNHDRTLTARANLAICLRDQKRLAEGEEEMRAVWLARSARNALHPDSLEAMRQLAQFAKARGNLEQATSLLEELNGLYAQRGEQNTPGALKTRHVLGDLLIKQERFEEAVSILDETWKDMAEAFGNGDRRTAAAQITLGQAHEKQGNFQSAETCYNQGIAQLEEHHPKARELTYYQAIRGYNLTNLGRQDEAEQLLLASLAASGEKSPYRQEITSLVIAHYRARGDEKSAAVYTYQD